MNFGPVIRPRSARNINREWRFVVNLPGGEDQDDFDDFVQTVKIQRCLREGESCNVLVSGYTSTVCRSSTSQQLLLILSFQTKIHIQENAGNKQKWYSIRRYLQVYAICNRNFLLMTNILGFHLAVFVIGKIPTMISNLNF